jgi:hypothetical protein
LAKGYLIAAGTLGGGSNQVQNSCGIANAHVYNIFAAFELTLNGGSTDKVFLMRNPWGVTRYNSTWHKLDSKWNEALKA